MAGFTAGLLNLFYIFAVAAEPASFIYDSRHSGPAISLQAGPLPALHPSQYLPAPSPLPALTSPAPSPAASVSPVRYSQGGAATPLPPLPSPAPRRLVKVVRVKMSPPPTSRLPPLRSGRLGPSWHPSPSIPTYR